VTRSDRIAEAREPELLRSMTASLKRVSRSVRMKHARERRLAEKPRLTFYIGGDAGGFGSGVAAWTI
jgi:hypothetical protein